MFQLIYSKISSERAIENLIAQYAHLLDKGDFAGVAALFKHGRIGSIGDFTEGQAEVEKMLHKNLQLYPDGTPRTAHVITNTVLTIDDRETSATAVSYVTIFQQDEERSFPLQPIMIGRYDDKFSRLKDEWHFIERNLSLNLTGDISHHAHPDGPAVKKLNESE